MNRFDENPAMTLEDIKETKRYGRMHGRTDNVKTVYPPQTKFAGGIMKTVYPPQTKFAGGIIKFQPILSYLIVLYVKGPSFIILCKLSARQWGYQGHLRLIIWGKPCKLDVKF